MDVIKGNPETVFLDGGAFLDSFWALKINWPKNFCADFRKKRHR